MEQHFDQHRATEGLASLEVIIPTPVQTVDSFFANMVLIQTAMLATLKKAFVGFLIGCGGALMVSMAYALIPTLRAVSMPLAYAFNSFPIFGLVPAIILTFGTDNTLSIAVIAALLSYFPILITLDRSFHSVPTELGELSSLCGAGRVRALRHIQLPLSLPALFLGFRLAVPGTIMGATLGELLGSRDGIGNLVSKSLYELDAPRMYAAFIEVALVCSLFAGAVILLERIAVPWAKTAESSGD